MFWRKFRICGFVGIVASLTFSLAWGQDQREMGFHFSVDGQFRYGNITGFVQVPRGGGAGTTSNERPKFDELGTNQAAIGDPSLTLGWNDHNIYAGASIVRLSGSDTLSSTLISNGTTFPAGTSVHADIRLEGYWFGYEYRFATNIINLRFFRSTAVGVALFNFDYKLDGTGGLSAARSFEKAAPQLGLISEWTPEGPFSLSGGVLSSLAFRRYPRCSLLI